MNPFRLAVIVLLLSVLPACASKSPAADGKPDLSGIWEIKKDRHARKTVVRMVRSRINSWISVRVCRSGCHINPGKGTGQTTMAQNGEDDPSSRCVRGVW
jgi:hypothetical protein